MGALPETRVHRRRLILTCFAGLIFSLLDPHAVSAQFACGCGAVLRFTEQIRSADLVVLAEFISESRPADPEAQTTTTVQIRRLIKGPRIVETDQILTMELNRLDDTGTSFLACAYKDPESSEYVWSQVLKVSECRIGYCDRVAELETDESERLRYFLPYLESQDLTTDSDAISEFLAAEYQSLSDLAPEFSRSKLRQWIRNRNGADGRLGVYGLMLGMCAHTVDAKFLDEMVIDRVPVLIDDPCQPAKDPAEAPEEDEVAPEIDAEEGFWEDLKLNHYQLGLGGLMQGYLLARGELALNRLDERYFQNPTADESDVMQGLEAIQFIWINGNDRIPIERLQKSMRFLLDRPNLAATVIEWFTDLERWSIRLELLDLYDKEGYATPEIQKAIEEFWAKYARAHEDAENEVPDEQAMKSLRKALNYPKFSLFAVRQLHLAGDWTVQDRVTELYFDPQFNQREFKIAVYRYLTECAKQARWLATPNPLAVQDAKKAELTMKRLQALDPLGVAEARKAVW